MGRQKSLLQIQLTTKNFLSNKNSKILTAEVKMNCKRLLTLILFVLVPLATMGDERVKDDTLKVGVYFESLCPDSKAFITTQLHPTYGKLGKYLDVEFYPYGNAESIQTHQHGGRWSFKCQHAILECTGNMQIACILDLDALTPSDKMDLVSCIMSQEKPNSSVDPFICIDQQELEDKLMTMDLVKQCSISHYGEELLLAMGNATAALDPPHELVPWITFNGESNPSWQEEARGNFENFICKNFLQSIPECN